MPRRLSAAEVAPIDELIRDEVRAWLDTHSYEIGMAVHNAVRGAFGEWLEKNGEDIIKRIA